MAFTPQQLDSGRWRSGYKLPGQPAVKRTFDYAGEALDWAEAAERDARDALATPAPAPTAPTVTLDPEPGSAVVTFAEHGADWVSRQGHLSVSSLTDYQRCVRVISASELGTVALPSVQLRDVQHWVTAQLADGVGRPTVNRRLKVLRMVWKDAIAHGLATADPSHGVKLLATDVKADRTVTRDEETALLAQADDTLRVLLLLGVDAGLRWGEAAGLTAGNVVEGEYLVVSQVVVTTTRTVRGYTKGHKLGHRLRKVGLTPRLAAALAPLVAAATDRDALLFTTADGRPLAYRNWLRRTYKPAVRRAGLAKPAPGFHGLRHTFGSRLAAAGVARSEIARMMGHADEDTTARYIHTADDGHRRRLLLAALASPAERKAARKAGTHLAAVS